MNQENKDMIRLLEGKLRMPIHISYISKYILKKTQEETKEILEQAINDGVIEESPLAKEYYQLKRK